MNKERRMKNYVWLMWKDMIEERYDDESKKRKAIVEGENKEH